MSKSWWRDSNETASGDPGAVHAERGYDAEQVDAEIAADKIREKSLGLTFGSSAAGPSISVDAAETENPPR